jgi:heme-degrading monooxygenase HmoA
MYTVVERRKTNFDKIEETAKRAADEFFPALQASDGFVGFYVVNDEEQGEHVVIMVWNTKEQSEKFLATQDAWLKVPDSLGQKLLNMNKGDTLIDLGPTS